MNRRKFIGNTFAGTLGTAFLGGIYAWQIEPFWLEFVERKMAVKGLPQSLEGKILMQISDMHIREGQNTNFVFLDNYR